MTEVIMPKMGDGMEEGTLLEWLKKDGEKVRTGEIIATIQTDKATLEIESPGSGALTGFLIQSGDTVPVGRPIALLLKDGETIPASWGSGGGVAAAAPAAEEAPAAAASTGEAPAAAAVSSESGSRVKVSPLAKKIAQELGVNLEAVQGSGPGGRIVEKDVRSAAASGAARPAAAAAAAPTPVAITPIVATAEDKTVKLSRLRQIIAQRTGNAKQTVPHFYVTVSVDLEKIFALREMFEIEESGKVSVNDFVVKACALALQEMPEVNASYQGDHVIQYGGVHIGVAAAVEDGLLVPVIKNAHAKTLRQLSVEAKGLVKKARDGKLLPDEMSGSTFSISNMGMLNVDSFSAIINEPNAAIIAIGTAKRVVVVDESTDDFEARWQMNITGSFDHRVLDGAVGAKFVNLVKSYLENPSRLLN